MRSAGTRYAPKAMTEPLFGEPPFDGRRCYSVLLSILTLGIEGRRFPAGPPQVYYFALADLDLCFVSFAGAVVAVGRTILPSSSTAA